ncbi:enamine deaminase RidA (YjgF/YER057c/UK114 family) [Rubricella aquisinus]|uniref:Enamine deaminase RidA (YjgF/YER057c/UK114 family) n=1 Tax=Rubricella aquisinus TaxID=2028108 RepID=A0A840X0J4_9RHOB|nr:RidA family protein [Rubricella aquisinus]MBB5515396.1 enamine deaminase RidA (YjgF/YER057c/UK114 family) [Rubricella aquisinus]
MERSAGYSRAVIQGDFAHVAGTTGYDYDSMQMPADIREQTRNCLATIAQALHDGGFTLEQVVRVNYYVTDRANVPAVFEEVGKVFADIRPAATMVICDLIDPAMLIEIEATAQR